jgi:hypothetical protein
MRIENICDVGGATGTRYLPNLLQATLTAPGCEATECYPVSECRRRNKTWTRSPKTIPHFSKQSHHTRWQGICEKETTNRPCIRTSTFGRFLDEGGPVQLISWTAVLFHAFLPAKSADVSTQTIGFCDCASHDELPETVHSEAEGNTLPASTIPRGNPTHHRKHRRLSSCLNRRQTDIMQLANDHRGHD